MNSSKNILQNLAWLVLLLITSNCVFASCNLASNTKKNKEIMDTICDPTLGKIELRHSIQKREIWLEFPKFNHKKAVLRVKSNQDPSLIGTTSHIKFITKSLVDIQGKNYLGLTISERTRSESTMGQCGGASEDYFVSYKITKNKFIEICRQKIASCAEHIGMVDLDLESIEHSGHEVHFPIFYNPKKDLYGTAVYDFESNKFLLPAVSTNHSE